MAIRITGLSSGMDTDSMVKELVSAASAKKTKLEGNQKKLSWKQSAWSTLNSKVKSFYSNQLSVLKYESNYSKKKTTVADSTIATVVGSSNAVNGSQTLAVKSLAKSGYLTGGKLKKSDGGTVTSDTKLSELSSGLTSSSSIKFTVHSAGKDTEVTLSGDSTINDVVKQLGSAGVTASFDETNQRIFVVAADSGAENDFSLEADNVNGLNALSYLGLMTTDEVSANKDTYEALAAAYADSDEEILASAAFASLKTTYSDLTDEELLDKVKAAYTALNDLPTGNSDSAVRITGQNAVILLNGAEFESSTNSFSINGLTITATAESASTTDSEGNVTYTETTINTSDDVDGIYDMIKEFFSEYNSLIEEFETLYNADSARDYDMLTSEEKEEMSDDEIEAWETKIKDALLRKDNDLGTLINTFKKAMLQSFEYEGTQYTLSSFGIETLGYFDSEENQRGVYHIAGDADDSSTSSKTDILKSMISTNPGAVTSFFTQLVGGLQTTMANLSKSSDSRSYGNFYDDKALNDEYSNYTDKIKEQEEYLTDLEDRYYDQFTAMEKSLSKINSQSSYISSLFTT